MKTTQIQELRRHYREVVGLVANVRLNDNRDAFKRLASPDVLDAVVDDSGRPWELIELGNGVVGFRDCPIRFRVSSEGNDECEPWPECSARKRMIEWLTIHLTESQKRKYEFPDIATYAELTGGLPFYADPHSKLKFGTEGETVRYLVKSFVTGSKCMQAIGPRGQLTYCMGFESMWLSPLFREVKTENDKRKPAGK